MTLFKAATALLSLLVCAAPALGQSSFSPREDTGLSDAPFQKDIALQCAFVTECFEGDGCSDTAFDAQLTGKSGGLAADAMVALVKMSSVSGDVELLGTASNDRISLTGGPLEARHMVTLSGQNARYTVHYVDGPMAITYLGTCQ